VVVVVIGATLAVDGVLARRYAAGSARHDAGTCRGLVLGLNLSVLSALAFNLLGVGRLTDGANTLAAAGLALALGGWALRYLSIWTLGRFFTWQVSILSEHRLVRHGPYRLLRHPSYTGGALALFGPLLLIGTGIGLAVAAAFYMPMLLRRIQVEERTLARHFGGDYVRYRAHSYRLIPLVY